MVSLARKLTGATFAGITLGFILYLLGSIALAVIPTLPPVMGLAGFGIGFGSAVGATLSEDVKEQASVEAKVKP